MHKSEKTQALIVTVLCMALSAIGLVHFAGSFKLLTLLAGCGMGALLFLSNLKPLRNAASAALLGFVIFSGLTLAWAMSGKFFLREFDKIFLAAGIFLFVVLFHRSRSDFEKSVCEILTGISGIYAILSVEASATGITERMLHALGYSAGEDLGFEAGTRMTGIFGNANMLSSVLALGVLLSVALLCRNGSRGERRVHAAVLAVNAFALLLAFSMGALACFGVSVVVYLLFAGKERGTVLLHMLCGAVPTVVFAFASFPFFGREDALRVMPLLLLAADAALAIVLEECVARKAEPLFQTNQKVVFGVLTAVILLAAVYIVAGLRLSDAYTFGDSLRRSAYPAPGSYTLSAESDGAVNVTVVSQNRIQTMMHTETVLYRGPVADAAFTVPEDSEVCYFTFTGEPGTVLTSASVGGEKIPLKYTLLPGFVANRLQGLRANQNAIQRVVFMADGMKLFRLSPVVGNGVGSFETGITRVQDFYYETRYVHNHYIQTMAESGVLGLTLWLAALVGMCALLWKGRHTTTAPWLYGALAGAMMMMITHPFVEVSMSFVVFICFVYAVFGLIVRTCAAQRKTEQPDAGNSARGFPLKNVVAAAIPLIFVLTVCGNLLAGAAVRHPMETMADAFRTMESVEKIDFYERNDILLTFVTYAQEDGNEYWVPKANEYAQRLSRVQSNSIPQALVAYYLNTAQYEQAIEMAKLGAVYSASDARVWNICGDYLRQIFGDSGEYSPLLGENGDRLKELLREYYAMFVARNETAMEPIVMEESTEAFLASV